LNEPFQLLAKGVRAVETTKADVITINSCKAAGVRR